MLEQLAASELFPEQKPLDKALKHWKKFQIKLIKQKRLVKN